MSHEPRITGGCSIHPAYDPSKCKKGVERCGSGRVVDCCTQTPDRDVIECDKCGMQKSVACTFDDDMN